MAQACLNFELGGDGEEMQDEESECLHPSNVAETEQVEESEFPSLNPEEEEDEEPMPDHNFEVKTVVGKYGKAKGVPRESVKLYLGNYTFRKTNELLHTTLVQTPATTISNPRNSPLKRERKKEVLSFYSDPSGRAWLA